MKKTKNNVVIFAGGVGKRMHSTTKPKQFLQLYGKEIIVYTIEHFQYSPDIDDIVVACKEEWIPFMQELVRNYSLDKVKWVVPGGATGQESIWHGVKTLAEQEPMDSVVLVHDGVRPLIDAQLIHRCVESVRQYGSAITVVPAIETIVQLSDTEITNIADRSTCYMARAPQCFILQDLFDAHVVARKEGKVNALDSASLMTSYGYPLHAVLGDYRNIKITTPTDFYMFKALLDEKENQQVFG